MKDEQMRERLKYAHLLQKARLETKRNSDGGWDAADLLETLAALIVVDLESEKARIAKEILDDACKPGGTPPCGQLCLPGLEPFPYEPDRMVKDDEGQVIKQRDALPRYLAAESRRMRAHARESTVWADRKTEVLEQYNEWFAKQVLAGVRREKATFEAFMAANPELPPAPLGNNGLQSLRPVAEETT